MGNPLFPAWALVALLASGCAAPLGEADVPRGQIDGAVLGPLLQPFPHLPVHLVELDRTDVTSPLGGFSFRNVPEGVYTLVAEAPGNKPTTVTVMVTADHITPIILQLFPVDPPPGIMVPEKFEATQTGLVLPGETCDKCQWRVGLQKHPEEVILRAEWDEETGNSADVILEVHSADDVLRRVEGDSPIVITLQGADIPLDERSLWISVQFSDDFVPQMDFQMDYLAEVYYEATRAQYLDRH